MKERVCTGIIFIMIAHLIGFIGGVENDRLTLTAGTLLMGACVIIMAICGRIIQVEYKRKGIRA